MKLHILSFIFLTAITLVFPVSSLACACCAESGAYSISTAKPGEQDIELLQNLKFDKGAQLFMTAAGFDGVKGLNAIAKSFESQSSTNFFSVTNAFSARIWKFNFKTKDGKTGALTLPMPAQMLNFKADIHDGRQGGGGGPLLYKELRFKGTVQAGNGFFQSSIIKPTTYFLVLQGRGNNCDNAGDYTHWRLEISGRNADYTFFGELSSSKAIEVANVRQ
ncbi:MAG: uncharacterized protein JWN60_448 [Acidobacteria bacterium]|nr:uncharacterized protein [Acidobacteriota bacterium]